MDRRRLPFTDEHKQKIREAKLKYKPTKEHIENAKKGLIAHIAEHYVEYVSKCKHRNFKHTKESKDKISKALGGRKKGYFYDLGKIGWKVLANEILIRDNFQCSRCGKKGTSKTLNVHHKIPYKCSNNNSPENLEVLCIPCHGIVENNWRRENSQNRPKSLNTESIHKAEHGEG